MYEDYIIRHVKAARAAGAGGVLQPQCKDLCVPRAHGTAVIPVLLPAFPAVVFSIVCVVLAVF